MNIAFICACERDGIRGSGEGLLVVWESGLEDKWLGFDGGDGDVQFVDWEEAVRVD